MKKISFMYVIAVFLTAILMSASLMQCKKEGDVIKNLNRSYTGSADSTVYASFYEQNILSTADVTPNVNDIIEYRGVQTIMHEYCGTSNCHGGPISPKFDSYADIMRYVSAGNPSGSKIWDYITTNNFNNAMPPVNSNHELTTTDKSIIYNWIQNGAKEKPDLNDFRPAAIAMMVSGCGSANCHNQATATGGWARAGYLGTLTTADTSQYIYINPLTGVPTNYCQLSNPTKLNAVWTAYKDSVKKFYADVVANASFRPWLKFSSPRSAASTRGPLNSYDDILMDIMYPKGVRSSGSVQYTDPVTLKTYYANSNFLNGTSSIISKIDSTLIAANPSTGVFGTTVDGSMAYSDGGLKPNEIALIKAWYFADPNIPAVWKYGNGNTGIFKYAKTGKIIKQ